MKKYEFIQSLYGFDTNLKLEEAIKLFPVVGCVYPDCENSYYIDSNCGDLSEIRCVGGIFYGDSETARELYEEYCSLNNITPITEEEFHKIRNENIHYESEDDLFIEEDESEIEL